MSHSPPPCRASFVSIQCWTRLRAPASFKFSRRRLLLRLLLLLHLLLRLLLLLLRLLLLSLLLSLLLLALRVRRRQSRPCRHWVQARSVRRLRCVCALPLFLRRDLLWHCPTTLERERQQQAGAGSTRTPPRCRSGAPQTHSMGVGVRKAL